VPTIDQLCEGVDDKIIDDDGVKKRVPEKQGNLRESLEIFEKFLEKMESTWKEKHVTDDNV